MQEVEYEENAVFEVEDNDMKEGCETCCRAETIAEDTAALSKVLVAPRLLSSSTGTNSKVHVSRC